MQVKCVISMATRSMSNKRVTFHLQNIVKMITQIVIVLAVFWLSFYTAVTVAPLIKVKYTNQYEISGRTTHPSAQFNPVTNYVRFAFILVATPLFFYGMMKPTIWRRKNVVRIILISVFVLSFFLSQASYYLTKHWNLDMFHDGEQLGTGTALYKYDRKLYSEIFFFHGAFSDPLLAAIPFNLWQPSIGSFFLFRSLVNVATYALFFGALYLLIKDTILFYIAGLFFFSLRSLYVYTIHRDVSVFLYLTLFFIVARHRFLFAAGYFGLSLLAAATIFVSIDRGVYLFVANLLLGVIYPFFQNHSRDSSVIFRSLRYVLISLLGYLVVFAAAYVLLGSTVFRAFVSMTFVEIPRMLPLHQEYAYPHLAANSFPVYWLPILAMVGLICITVYVVIRRRQWFDSTFIIPVFLLLFAVLSFKSALGRNSFSHTLYVIQYLFLAIFAYADYLKDRLPQYMNAVPYVVVALLFITRFSEVDRLYTPPKYDASDLRIYVSLPTIDDNYWLKDEAIAVREYIRKNTSEKDFVFAFVNDAAYYYLTARPNPTRFYSTWFTEPNFYQQEMLRDLKKNPPVYIIYESKSPHNDVDGIPNSVRLKNVNQWILDNYEEDITLYDTLILRRNKV